MLVDKRYLIAVFILACVSSCRPFGGEKIPPEYKEFFRLPLGVQHEKFRTYPVEKQLDIYHYAMGREPPDMGLADEVADGGAKVIPVLFERLDKEDSESHKESIIHIFQAMAIKGHLRGRQDVSDELRQVISAMRQAGSRMRSEQMLEKIERNV